MLLNAFIEKYYPRPVQPTTVAARVNALPNDLAWRQKMQGPVRLEQCSQGLQHKYACFIGTGLHGDLLTADQMEKRRRLTSGAESGGSEDDMALAALLLREGFSTDETEAVMRATRYREKFDEWRGEQRYLEKTINKAAADYEPNNPGSTFTLSDVKNSIEPVAATKLLLSDGLIQFTDTPPPPRDYVAVGMIGGKAYVMGGYGGAGKSQLAIQIAFDVATGGALLGECSHPGSVLMVLGEDDASEIERRANATIAAFNVNNQRDAVAKRVRAFGLVGQDIRLTAQNGGALKVTTLGNQIIEATANLKVESGEAVRLIVLDHLGLLHGGDFNAREAAALTMRVANHIAQQTGAAVLLLAHSPKSASEKEESDAQAIAGSTAFVDQARGAFVMAGMREVEAKRYGIDKDARKNYVSFATVKNNYGPSGVVRWFQRRTVLDYGVSVLAPVNLAVPAKEPQTDGGAAGRILTLVAQHRGQFSRTKLRDLYSGVTGPLKACKRDVEIALDQLVMDGRLIDREPTEDDRKRYRKRPANPS